MKQAVPHFNILPAVRMQQQHSFAYLPQSTVALLFHLFVQASVWALCCSRSTVLAWLTWLHCPSLRPSRGLTGCWQQHCSRQGCSQGEGRRKHTWGVYLVLWTSTHPAHRHNSCGTDIALPKLLASVLAGCLPRIRGSNRCFTWSKPGNLSTRAGIR